MQGLENKMLLWYGHVKGMGQHRLSKLEILGGSKQNIDISNL
jgi:hypothetical protein